MPDYKALRLKYSRKGGGGRAHGKFRRNAPALPPQARSGFASPRVPSSPGTESRSR